eukprot:gb/GECH01010495.1/.p1 GENE.gb/GECH01010495.1/~~gb/GECH01010495.1/.p1  ORF type:complete len:194 (+),score=34.85 gb/GECH01010495.1/:1-582(+)
MLRCINTRPKNTHASSFSSSASRTASSSSFKLARASFSTTSLHPSSQMTFNVSSKSPQTMTTTIEAGSHKITVDEPPSSGGSDMGPNPLEYSLASLVGCETVTARMAAKKMKLQLEDINMEAKGTLDMRGFMGTEGVQRHFEKVKIIAQVTTTASQEEVDRLAHMVEDRCPVYSMFKASGTKMESSWERISKE